VNVSILGERNAIVFEFLLIIYALQRQKQTSFYKDHAPLVNAMRGPLEWNTYDVVYTAPRFKADGSLDYPARITVFHNGVLVQNNVTINGLTLYIGLHHYPEAHGEDVISLQDHGNKTQFRNIWLRKL